MSVVAAAVVGSSLIGAVTSSNAASNASDAQVASTEAGIAEQRRQFEEVQETLAPFVNAGESSIAQMLALNGSLGEEAYTNAVSTIENGPQYQQTVRAGEGALLANASATGGLRGGNTQLALAELRPELLSRAIDQRYSQLGTTAQLGQASAAQQASVGLQTGQNISNLQQTQGAAIAGNHLAQGQIINSTVGDLTRFLVGGGF